MRPNYRPWTPEEDAFLAECTRIGLNSGKLAPMLDRTKVAIAARRRAKLFKLPQRPKRPEPVYVHRALVADISAMVAKHFRVPIEDLTSQSREHWICRPRQVAMFLAHEVSGRGYSEIGRKFSRDHSTVIYAVRQVERLMDEQQSMKDDVETLTAKILSPEIIETVDNSIVCGIGWEA